MEQTLGKRIVQHRKRLGMTQDKLAEQLGVTAQAVSKWENDQACPDITTLPKLAEIFGITTDDLLGVASGNTVHEAEVVAGQETKEQDGIHIQNGNWHFTWDSGRKASLVFALWIVLAGGLLLLSNLMQLDANLWDIAWPSALLMFGLAGLFSKFSFFRLGCALFGGYYLFVNLSSPDYLLGKEIILPVCIVLFGLSLLMDAMKKGKPRVTFTRNGGKKDHNFVSSFNVDGDTFEASTSFGSEDRLVELPRLSGGKVDVSFGEMTIDLSGCEKISDDCHLTANCSFGELEILVPSRWEVRSDSSKAFASIEVNGHPDAQPEGIIYLECNASFGEIEITYV